MNASSATFVGSRSQLRWLFYPMSGKAKKPAAKPAAAATKGGKKATEKPVKSTSKKVAEAAPRKKDWKSQHKHLFNKETRYDNDHFQFSSSRLQQLQRWPIHSSQGPRPHPLCQMAPLRAPPAPGDIKAVKSMNLFQRAILKKRLKVPPAINHFSKTLEKNQGFFQHGCC